MNTMRHRKKRTSNDANYRLPHDLTGLIRQTIDHLPDTPKNNYLKSEVFSKFMSADTAPPQVRRNAAIRKWLSTEQTNEWTNTRLMTICEDYNVLPRVKYSAFMDTVRYFVKKVLGDVPPFEVLLGGFSGGASTSRSRTDAHPALKYTGEADVTPRALDYAVDVINCSTIWPQFTSSEQIRVVDGNVLFTVDKTTDIDRVACKEPDLNMYMQRGIGTFIRRRLRRFGIDLNDQSRNRDLARIGSVDGSLATIDLSSASDSVSRELVFQSVPTDWYVIMDSVRSPTTNIDGDIHVNEMFSSMGNGFTFELESLLFWAIAKAASYCMEEKGVISVYGDDIIVPSRLAPHLIWVLGILGFQTNESKTFYEGPFRESCGGHYYNGVDITPFYIRKPVTHLIDLIHLLNSIRKWSSVNDFPILLPEFEEFWRDNAELVPKCFWGGSNLNDKTRLVTMTQPDSPKRLIERKGREKGTGDGGYLLWLDSVEDRQLDVSDGFSTSTFTQTLKSYKSARVYGGHRYEGPLFLHEVNVP